MQMQVVDGMFNVEIWVDWVEDFGDGLVCYEL